MSSAYRQYLKAEERRIMAEAIKKLQLEDPERFVELSKRAQDSVYDAKVKREKQEEAAKKYIELQKLTEFEKARRLNMPVIVDLPNISQVRGMVAFRVWGYDRLGLRSTVMSYHWREVNFADKVPGCHNQSGLYCIKLSSLGVLTAGVSYFGTGRQNVSGFIELLGRVEEHTDGVLRAEVARLMCLFVTSENSVIGSIVGQLHELYPVTPVFVLNPEQLADVIMREVLRQSEESERGVQASETVRDLERYLRGGG